MSNYILSNGELLTEDELQHYGVLGMKWGVRRDASSAYAKASKKARKLETKASKLHLKSAKLRDKGLKKELNARNDDQYDKARKLQYKANKLELKSAKLSKKGSKWMKKMEKYFKDVKVSDVSQEHLDAGRKYMYMLKNG